MKSYIRDSDKALLLMTVGQKRYIFYGFGKFVVILKIFTQALYLSVLKKYHDCLLMFIFIFVLLSIYTKDFSELIVF